MTKGTRKNQKNIRGRTRKRGRKNIRQINSKLQQSKKYRNRSRIRKQNGRSRSGRSQSGRKGKKIQKGGLEPLPAFANKDKFHIFNTIIHNSDIRLISHSSAYGLVFGLTLKDGVEPIHMDSEGNQNRHYAIKMGFIHHSTHGIFHFANNLGNHGEEKTIIKETVDEDEFIQEVVLHREIYDTSIQTFNKSIVPDVIKDGYYIVDRDANDHSFHLVRKLLKSVQDEPSKKLLVHYYNDFRDESNRYARPKGRFIGLYLMKFLDGYQPIPIAPNGRSLLYPIRDKRLYRVVHIMLGIIGYIHGDAHTNNVLIRARGDDIDIKVIDFGRIIPIPPLNPLRHIQRPIDMNVEKITTIVHNIKRNCDIFRRNHSIPINQWQCYSLFWSGIRPYEINELTEFIQEKWDSALKLKTEILYNNLQECQRRLQNIY